jgi:uncharacterized OB-fold protein
MPYLKPLPAISAASTPFWDGLREHVLRLRKCNECGHVSWPIYPACRNCQSEQLEWIKGSGLASVWSYSVVHRAPAAFADDAPYVVVLAKLADEPGGSIVMGNLIDCDPDDVTIGMPLKVVYEDLVDEDLTLYKFAPADD